MNTHIFGLTYLAHCGGIHLDDRAILHVAVLAAGSLLTFGAVFVAGKQRPQTTDNHRQEAS